MSDDQDGDAVSIYPPVRRTMIGLLSTPRMSTYQQACGGDVEAAVDLYRWNLDVSMALFESIHYLEVATRNRIDGALSTLAGAGNDWLDAPPSVPLTAGTRSRIALARSHAGRDGRTPTHGHVIAEITFGFWPYLFSAGYNLTLWAPALKGAFPTATRADLHSRLGRVADLRNRIGHHEPLIALDIATEYTRILELAELVETRLGWWIDSTSRVDAINRRRP
ncbi:hypothetical protein [Cellulomonas sp. NPDC058312]|uniref:hypothetical protein n=1 Tax=Cellulomonas sp. NPDC058312 TaxID=3346441 RepID=UPI0036E44694